MQLDEDDLLLYMKEKLPHDCFAKASMPELLDF